MRTRRPAVLGRIAAPAALGILVVLVAAGEGAQGTRGWTAPKTSWGDPDLTGTFVNDNEYATPLERPDEFKGRRLEDIKAEEFKDRAYQEAVTRLQGGRVRGPDDWWLQNLDLSKRSQPWLVVDPPDGRIPALTPEGQKRASGRVRSSFVGGPFDGPEDLNPLERCITRGVPGSMIPVMYGNSYQIVQTPGYVVITYEIVHEARVIPVDGRPHLGQAIRQHMGDARGRWEGDTLVVETTNFTRLGAYRNANPATLKITERFRRVAPDRIVWTATMEDPDMWVRPWTIAMPMTLDRQESLPFECHEHNYGLMNILKAARAAEK
jgi:hypothetical protein